MEAILIGLGQLHTFRRIDTFTKIHRSIAWDFVNCSPVPAIADPWLLTKSILYTMDQHDKSLVNPLSGKCPYDITLIRQIIVEAVTVHSVIPHEYVLPFLIIVKEEVRFLTHLVLMGLKIPKLSILHGVHTTSDAYGTHRCRQCTRSLCNTLVVSKHYRRRFYCHSCCMPNASTKMSQEFLVENTKVEMHFMSLTFMQNKVRDLSKRFNSSDVSPQRGSFIELIKQEVEGTLRLTEVLSLKHPAWHHSGITFRDWITYNKTISFCQPYL